MTHSEFIKTIAKSFQNEARELIEKLAKKLGITIDKELPLRSFFPPRGSGELDDEWNYMFHGMECRFRNKKTKQVIDVILKFPDEYGVLDPMFFGQYIKTHPNYLNFPLIISDEYEDGLKLIEYMLKLGEFKVIENEATLDMDGFEYPIRAKGVVVK